MSWISVGSSTRDPQYFRSQPAQNAPPSPQSTATAASASRSNAVKASTSASALSGSIAFRACGREWITVHTLPFFSILTVMATSSIDWYFDFVSPYSYKDQKITRLNSSHVAISYAVFCLQKKKQT